MVKPIILFSQSFIRDWNSKESQIDIFIKFGEHFGRQQQQQQSLFLPSILKTFQSWINKGAGYPKKNIRACHSRIF